MLALDLLGVVSMLKSAPLALLLLPLVAGCFAPPARGAAPSATAANYLPPQEELAVDGVPLDSRSELRVQVNAPSAVPYDLTMLGPTNKGISIKLTNTSRHDVDVAGADAVFSATLNGVAFPCATRPQPRAKNRAPSKLAPGESMTLDREIRCSMPLPGHYKVGVFLTFEERGGRTAPDFGDELTFTVVGNGPTPRPYASRDGLYMGLAGAPVTLPMSPEAWARGDYRVVVASINASSDPIPLGKARLSFLTYKGMSALPCSGANETLEFPRELASGATVTLAVPVACAPSEEGMYQIVGRLAFDGDRRETEIGRVILVVTHRPIVFAPGPETVASNLTE